MAKLIKLRDAADMEAALKERFKDEELRDLLFPHLLTHAGASFSVHAVASQIMMSIALAAGASRASSEGKKALIAALMNRKHEIIAARVENKRQQKEVLDYMNKIDWE